MATKKYSSKLLSKTPVADDTIEFRLEKPAGLDYRAGQYFDIFLQPASADAPKNDYAHGFSFVSAPFEDYIAATTRMRSHSTFKKALNALPVDSPVEVEASWGNYTLRKKADRPIVFLIGGIGITPVKSMLKQAMHEQSRHNLTLLYSNHTPSDAAYIEDFEAMARQNPNFSFVPTYTREKSSNSGVEQGRIDADMIQRHVPELDSTVFYTSGPRNMVAAMQQVLEQLNIDEDNIKIEEFDGY